MRSGGATNVIPDPSYTSKLMHRMLEVKAMDIFALE